MRDPWPDMTSDERYEWTNLIEGMETASIKPFISRRANQPSIQYLPTQYAELRQYSHVDIEMAGYSDCFPHSSERDQYPGLINVPPLPLWIKLTVPTAIIASAFYYLIIR